MNLKQTKVLETQIHKLSLQEKSITCIIQDTNLQQSEYFIKQIKNWLHPQQDAKQDKSVYQSFEFNVQLYRKLGLKGRVYEILTDLNKLFATKQNLNIYQDTYFVNQLFLSFLENINSYSLLSYYSLFNNFILKTTPEFSEYLVRDICQILKNIRLNVRATQSFILSKLMGNLLIILQNAIYYRGQNYSKQLKDKLKRILTIFQPTYMSYDSPYKILSGRSLVMYLIFYLKHNDSDSWILSILQKKFHKCILMGYDLKVLIQLVHQYTYKQNSKSEIGLLLRICIICLRQYNKMLLNLRLNNMINNNNDRIQCIAFAQYIKGHQQMLKQIQTPFSQQRPEILLKNIFKSLKEQNCEKFQNLLKEEFSQIEKGQINDLLNHYRTETGEKRRILSIKYAKIQQ